MIKVLSLFDGISGARQALKELNIDCAYYASEIDKFAIQVSKNNYPDIVQIGNVKGIIIEDDYIFYNQDNDPMQNGGSFKSDVDLLIGGSPCQDLSVAKRNGKGLEGERSGLFYEYLRILHKVKPKYFVLENVASMKKTEKDKISLSLGLEPIMINSALLTAQQRKRLYWVGKLQEDGSYKKVEIEYPQNQSQKLQLEKDWCYATIGSSNNRIFRKTEKVSALTASMFKGIRGAGRPIIAHKSIMSKHLDEVDKSLYRMLTLAECERLQGFPDNYSKSISNTQRYKALGNSFTVPVIKHILQHLFLKELCF